jgi:RHS repeat-associated protein
VRVNLAYTKVGEVASVTRFLDVAGTVKVGTTTNSYDDARRLVGIDHKNAAGVSVGTYSYAYDKASRLTSETFNGVSKTYAYDATNQLTNDNGTLLSYDKTGNRTKSGYVTTAGNRTTNDGTWTYTYDDAGQMLTKSKSGESSTYTYDFNGQMTKAVVNKTVGNSLTSNTVTYKYDAWGNRIERGLPNSPANTERYVVDGWDTAKPGAMGSENFDIAIDLNSANSVTQRRMYGAGFDEPIARQDANGVVTWYGADRLGSVRQVFDNTGAVTGSRSYAAFGAVTTTSGTGLDRIGYTGTSTESITGLVGDNARQYDPGLGRWTSEDPLGFAAGDANLNRYVGNGPTNGRDPSGMFDLGETSTIIREMADR